MIAVVYDFSLKPNHFIAYQALWKQMVAFLRTRGAIGSALHRVDDQRVVIYSRWPDLKTYKASWPDEKEWESSLPPAIVQLAQSMKEAIQTDVVTTVMTVEEALF